MKSKKVRIFIYSLVAWFVGMAVIVYDFSVSYAASFNENVEDAEWRFYHVFSEDKAENGSISEPDEFPDWFDNIPQSDLPNKKYIEHADRFCLYDNKGSIFCERITIASDNEIVVVFDYNNAYGIYYLSVSNIVGDYYHASNENLSDLWHYNGLQNSQYNSDDDGDYFYKFYPQNYNYGSFVYGIRTYKMKVFYTYDDAKKYLTTGDESGLAWQGASPQYDGDNIYLNDFQMIVHDSNAYSAYYLEFKYTIPEQLRDAASLQLQIEQSYEWTSCALGDSIRRPYTYTGNNYIDLLQYPTGFKLYLSDINSVQQFLDSFQLTHHQRAVLGAESIIDTSALSIGGFGGESIMRITNSKLYMTCYVIANNKFGVNYTGAVDFMTGANDMSSYTPDSSGNYKYNGDLKNQGHYYTDVSTDAAGNVTYNYYYYGDDNSKTEISAKDSADNTLTVVPVPGQTGSIINNITMPDHIFVNVSGSSGGGSSSGSNSDVGNVTIEDDDLSFNSLRDSIKDGYGLIDDTDTGSKGDGLIAMLSDLFGYLPAKFVGLIMLGTSSVVGIAVLRMIFKR